MHLLHLHIHIKLRPQALTCLTIALCGALTSLGGLAVINNVACSGAGRDAAVFAIVLISFRALRLPHYSLYIYNLDTCMKCSFSPNPRGACI